MAKTIKIEAIVLKKKSLLNKDLLVTFFTREEGKLKVFAKGAKKITSRRLAHLQTGNIIKAIINKKDDRLYLQETKLISGLSQIKEDPEKSKFLYYCIFAIERLLPENQRDFSVYRLLMKFLIELTKKSDFSQISMNRFIEKLLISLGYINQSLDNQNIQQTLEEIINEKLPSFVI